MIVHFSGWSFHSMKEHAEEERRRLGLPRTRYQKVEVVDREGLAALLNGFIGRGVPAPVEPTPTPEVDTWVPAFVKLDWARRDQLARARKENAK